MEPFRDASPASSPELPELTRDRGVSLFKRARKQAEESFVCEGCGYRPPRWVEDTLLHAHHIHRVVDGGPHTEENLVLLCANCHAMAHALFPVRLGHKEVPDRDTLLQALSDPDAFIQARQQKAIALIEQMRKPPKPCRCGEPRDRPGMALCRNCYNAKARQWRTKNPGRNSALVRAYQERKRARERSSE